MDSHPNAVANPQEGPNMVAMQQTVQQQQTNVTVVGVTNVTQVEQTHVTVVQRNTPDDDDSDFNLVYLVCAVIFFAITITLLFFYGLFLVCKYLVVFMIVEDDITVIKPVSGRIRTPVLDLSLRSLYFLSTTFENLTYKIQHNLIIIFYIRVMVSQVFDLVIILYLNIEAPITGFWVLHMVITITFCSVMTVSVILNFCCRNGLDSGCNGLDAINNFNKTFFLFKLHSFLSSLILLINELVFVSNFGTNALVSFFEFVTCVDLWLIVLTFIAMFVKYLSRQNTVTDIEQPNTATDAQQPNTTTDIQQPKQSK